MVNFPRQDIPESKKNEQFCKDVLKYAISLYRNDLSRKNTKITRLWEHYNGKINKASIAHLTNTYSKDNNCKFVDYKLGRPKISLLHGEMLKLPLSANVTTVNKGAVDKKAEEFYNKRAISLMKPDLAAMEPITGVNPFKDVDVPEFNDESAWEKMNFNSKNEIAAQIIVNDHTKNRNLKNSLSQNFLDLLVSAGCFGHVDYDDKTISYRDIDERNAIYIDSDRDPLLKRSIIAGERRPMTVNDIMTKWGHLLTKYQRDVIHTLQSDKDQLDNETQAGWRSFIESSNTNIYVETYTVEWFSPTPYRRKVIKDKKNPKNDPYKKNISDEFYQKNRKKIENDVKNGKYTIETAWRTEVYTGTQIGPDIFVACGKKEFQYVDVDNPGRNMLDYVGLKLPTRDGVRVSVQEIINELSHTYNIIMYQITRELTKAKGKVVVYDQAFLPKGKSINDVLYNMTNDSLLLVDSSEEGGLARQGNNLSGIKEIDLGVSGTVQQLISLKMNIEDTVDRLTGVPRGREGITAASATATNAQSDLEASRTITFPIFYFFDEYVETILTRIIEKTKIIYKAGNLEEESTKLLGTDIHNFIVDGVTLFEDNFRVCITDSRKEREVRDRMIQYAQLAINNKELSVKDVFKAEMQETVSEIQGTLDKSWEELERIKEESAQKDRDAQQQQTEMTLQAQTEDREDRQRHEIELEKIKAGLQSGQATQEASNQAALDQNKIAQEQAGQPQEQAQSPM